jgi:hypothetical protein
MNTYQLPKDFTPITLQRIFNLAWQAFVVEKRRPARDHEGCCSYLTDDGRKCAVGLALPDGHEAQRSGSGFNTLTKRYPELFDVPSHADTDNFQRKLHDGISSIDGAWIDPEGIEIAYRRVAAEYGLTIPGETK